MSILTPNKRYPNFPKYFPDKRLSKIIVIAHKVRKQIKTVQSKNKANNTLSNNTGSINLRSADKINFFSKSPIRPHNNFLFLCLGKVPPLKSPLINSIRIESFIHKLPKSNLLKILQWKTIKDHWAIFHSRVRLLEGQRSRILMQLKYQKIRILSKISLEKFKILKPFMKK